jgi:hypothetical protein
MQTQEQPKQSIAKLYFALQDLRVAGRAREAKGLVEAVEGRLHEFEGPADFWFNFGTDCARLRMSAVEIEAFIVGEQQWPNNIDLLCAQFQCYYSSHQDPEKAKQINTRLENIPVVEKGRYWRYWVYSAIYQANILGNREKGIQLLDQGLLVVQRDNLAEFIRSYRRVYLDSPPSTLSVVDMSQEKLSENTSKLIKEYQDNVAKVVEKYKLGLELGVENGYSIVLLLAELLQEQVYADAQKVHSRENESVLKQALDLLSYAESMFTDSANFPLQSIYTQKVNVLMGLKLYDEAHELLLSIQNSGLELTQTQTLQLQRAALGAGKSLGLNSDEVVKYILSDKGQALAIKAQQNENLADMLKITVRLVDYLSGENKDKSNKSIQESSSREEMSDGDILNRAFNILVNNPDQFVAFAQTIPQIANLVKYVCSKLDA